MNRERELSNSTHAFFFILFYLKKNTSRLELFQDLRKEGTYSPSTYFSVWSIHDFLS